MKMVDRARELYVELMGYDNCPDDAVDEAAQLLLDLANEIEYLNGRIDELDPLIR